MGFNAILTSYDTYSSDNINNWCWSISLVLVIHSGLLTNKGPQFIQIHSWFVIFVHCLVEVTHTHFTKVSWMAVQ